MWFLLSSFASAACPDLEEAVAAAEEAAAEVRLADAGEALERAEAAMGCTWAGPVVLARFWNAEGVRATFEGDSEAARSSFAAARRVAPEVFDAAYGSKLRAAWEGAQVAEPSATLLLEPAPVRSNALLDGLPLTSEPIPAGLHLVQVGPEAAPAFGELLLVVPGTLNTVRTGLAEERPAPAPVSTTPAATTSLEPKPKKKRSPVLLVAGGGAAAVGAVFLGLAERERSGKIPAAPSVEALDAARGRQLGFGYTGFSLIGLGAIGAGLHFAL